MFRGVSAKIAQAIARDQAAMKSNIDLWSLRVFLAVCETGSMTEAGRKLKLTQPAVSRIIRQLDEAIGLPVMDRDLRPIRLTNAGEALRKKSERVVREADELIPTVREAVNGKLALLRIGLTESVASLLVPLLTGEIAKFATTLSVWDGHSDQHKNALKRRELDLVVTSNTHDNDGLECIKLVSEPCILVLPAELAGSAPRDLEALAKTLPFLRYSARTYTGSLIDRHLRRLDINVPRQLEFDSTRLLVSMVSAGRGWAIMTPTSLLGATFDPTKIVPEPLPAAPLVRETVIVCRNGELGSMPTRLAAAAATLLRNSYLADALAQMPWLEGRLVVHH
jgi:DNA-binding transcriptional LysR family regulator